MVAVEAALAVTVPCGKSVRKYDVANGACLLANATSGAFAVYIERLVFYEEFIKKISQ